MSVAQLDSVVAAPPRAAPPQEVVVYSRSSLFYWWPVWAIGYVLALVTYLQGEQTAFNEAVVLMHPSKNLGVIYTVVFLLVLLMTNVTVRGIASLTVIITVLALTFLFAYLDWWDNIFSAVSTLAIYMNMGFDIFFSTSVFILWASAFFLFDRMNYWRFRPGQLIHERVFGGGAQTYDTHGMSVAKLRDDLFRHWILGFGSGDLQIASTGARKEEFTVPNVLSIGSKLQVIQRLVSMKPDESRSVVTAAGGPA
ncbi:MAG: hypothetical protein FJ271_20565 [Planctomycetes bacterium]|nr:hypothetical protein [Planctomycetota bacterium]